MHTLIVPQGAGWVTSSRRNHGGTLTFNTSQSSPEVLENVSDSSRIFGRFVHSAFVPARRCVINKRRPLESFTVSAFCAALCHRTIAGTTSLWCWTWRRSDAQNACSIPTGSSWRDIVRFQRVSAGSGPSEFAA